MPGFSIQTQAFVVLRRPPSEAFQSLSLFSEEQGSLAAMQRLSGRAGAGPALDLFDEAEVALESSNQGQSWFVREVRIVARHAAIGRSYDSLRFASKLASVVARNPVHEESRRTVAEMLRNALAAFDRGPRPDIVYFKRLFRFARDEGYPVAQEWLPSMAGTAASALLSLPSDEQKAPPSEVAGMTQSLEKYLRGSTEILLD